MKPKDFLIDVWKAICLAIVKWNENDPEDLFPKRVNIALGLNLNNSLRILMAKKRRVDSVTMPQNFEFEIPDEVIEY